MYQTDFDSLDVPDGEGHWTTIDGHHVYIAGPGPGRTASERSRFHWNLANQYKEKGDAAHAAGNTAHGKMLHATARIHEKKSKKHDSRRTAKLFSGTWLALEME